MVTVDITIIVLHFSAFASMDHFNAPSILAHQCAQRMGIGITEHLMD